MSRSAMVVIGALCTAGLGLAQDIAGTWTATADDSSLGPLQLRLLKVSKDSRGKLTGTLYTGEATYQCSAISLKGTTLSFVAGERRMSFEGILDRDGKSILGWFQDGVVYGRLSLWRMAGEPDAGRVQAGASATSSAGAPPSGESAALLARALAKLAGTGRRLLKYTCLETVERFYYSAPPSKLGRNAMTEAPKTSCQGRTFSPPGKLTLDAQDRLRLQVAVSEGKEIDSWVSADGFDSRSILDLVDGPASTGAFGTALVDIFENAGARYTFLGKRTEGSREIFDYGFEVPLAASHYFVKSGSVSTNTEYHGSFEIDGATAELIRVASETAEQQATASACRFRTTTDYHYETIGDGRFLIPLRSSNDGVLPSGNESRSRTTFSGCHEYGVESSLILGEVPVEAAAGAAPKAAPPLPPGLLLTLALLNPIDGDTAAAGDAVSARVVHDVRAPGSKELLVPQGAVAHGRVVQLRRMILSREFLVGIRFDTIEQNGTVGPLDLRPERLVEMRTDSGSTLVRRGPEFALSPVSRPGERGGWFLLAAPGGHATLRAGTESRWITGVR